MREAFLAATFTAQPVHLLQHPKDQAQFPLKYMTQWRTHCSADITGQLPVKLDTPGSSFPSSQVVILSWDSGAQSNPWIVLTQCCQSWVRDDLRWGKSRQGDKLRVKVSNWFSNKPEEGLFRVTLGRNVVVRKILLSVEDN